MMKMKSFLSAAVAVATISSAAPAFAGGLPSNGTAAGSMNVQMVVAPGCSFANASSGTSAGASPNAMMDFGTIAALSTGSADAVATSTTSSSGSGSQIQVSCSSSYVGANAPYMDIAAGLHASGSQRQMIGPGGALVPYNVFSDAGRNIAWVAGTPVQLVIPTAGVATPVPVYGRVPSVAGLADGTYTDTVALTLYY